MSYVIYLGTADVQVFLKADFEKAGVDQTKLSFPHGVEVHVSEEVAKVLTSNEGVFGDFPFEQTDLPEPQPEVDEQDPPTDEADKKPKGKK